MRMTTTTRMVLQSLLAAHEAGEQTYSYKISKEKDLLSGTVSQILNRLLEEDLVVKKREQKAEGPLRNFFYLTEAGVQKAREVASK